MAMVQFADDDSEIEKIPDKKKKHSVEFEPLGKKKNLLKEVFNTDPLSSDKNGNKPRLS